MSNNLTFVIDGPTVDLIEELKVAFGVKTTAEVMRRTLALALLVSRLADEDGVVTMIARDGAELHLRLRDPEPVRRTIGHRMRRLGRVLKLIPTALR